MDSKHSLYRPNKKISVFRVTGLKILGRVGTHIFLIIIFSWKKKFFYAFWKAKYVIWIESGYLKHRYFFYLA